MQSKTVRRTWIAALTIGVFLALISADPLLVIAAAIAFCVVASFFAAEEGPPIVGIALVNLWLISAAQLFYYCVWLREPLDFPRVLATFLSFGCVVTLAAGARVASKLFRNGGSERGLNDYKLLNFRIVFVMYLLFTVVNADPVMALAFGMPRVTQLLLTVMSLKWVFFFLLAMACFEQRKGYRFLCCAIALEIGLGLTGFWGSFIMFGYVYAVAFAYSRRPRTPRHVALAGAMLAGVFVLALYWTAIKPEFRAYLTRGLTEQRVNVGLTSRVAYATALIRAVRGRDLADAVEDLVHRIGYIDYFADTISFVPEVRPYGRGEILGEAVRRVFMPRMFFPNKPVIDDSEMTSEYTGRRQPGRDEATSISIGYFGEAYADWGPWAMFLFIFAVGFMYGIAVRVLSGAAHGRIIGESLAVGGLTFLANSIPSTPKMLGGTITAVLVLYVIRMFWGGWLTRLVTGSRDVRAQQEQSFVPGVATMRSEPIAGH